MITRISSVIRPKGSDLIFDHPYNADFVRLITASLAPFGVRRTSGSGMESTPANSAGRGRRGARAGRGSAHANVPVPRPRAAGSGVENEAAIYRVLLQPFMCHCRAGEGERLHMGLGEAGGR